MLVICVFAGWAGSPETRSLPPNWPASGGLLSRLSAFAPDCAMPAVDSALLLPRERFCAARRSCTKRGGAIRPCGAAFGEATWKYWLAPNV